MGLHPKLINRKNEGETKVKIQNLPKTIFFTHTEATEIWVCFKNTKLTSSLINHHSILSEIEQNPKCHSEMKNPNQVVKDPPPWVRGYIPTRRTLKSSQTQQSMNKL